MRVINSCEVAMKMLYVVPLLPLSDRQRRLCRARSICIGCNVSVVMKKIVYDVNAYLRFSAGCCVQFLFTTKPFEIDFDRRPHVGYRGILSQENIGAYFSPKFVCVLIG